MARQPHAKLRWFQGLFLLATMAQLISFELRSAAPKIGLPAPLLEHRGDERFCVRGMPVQREMPNLVEQDWFLGTRSVRDLHCNERRLAKILHRTVEYDPAWHRIASRHWRARY